MRVMVIVKANPDSEAGVMPSQELLDDMMKYNEELQKAGIMRDGAGLKPSSHGARIRFSESGQVDVIEGPCRDSNDLIAGYWIWEVKSKEEAIEWARRCPHPHGKGTAFLEIRPFYQLDDFEPCEAIDTARRLESERAAAKQA